MLSLFVGYSRYWTYKTWAGTLLFLGVKESHCHTLMLRRSELLFSSTDGVANASFARSSLFPVYIDLDTTCQDYARHIFVSLMTDHANLFFISFPGTLDRGTLHPELAILLSNNCLRLYSAPPASLAYETQTAYTR